MKIQNKIFAIPMAPAAIPPKPKTAAISATMKKIKAHQSILIPFIWLIYVVWTRSNWDANL